MQDVRVGRKRAMQGNTDRFTVEAGGGKSVNLGGLGVHFKLWGDQTQGLLSVVEHPMDAGRLVPPHVHANEDEYSYVLQGEFGVRIGDFETTVGSGSYIFKPRAIPHTFWNAGPEPARLIEMISPAGFEQFFDRLADIYAAAGNGAPDQVAIGELAARYNLAFTNPEWIPELKGKYNLKLLGEP
jgi:mannose-6-phosphate isomerase-like protein (cupin superfamily)